MKSTINYDFSISKINSKKIEDVSYYIDNILINEMAEKIKHISSCWDAEAAEALLFKCNELSDSFRKISKEINAEIEQIDKISRHMYLIEQENKEIAENREE